MKPNFSKSPDGLCPAIVQDAETNVVLMLGYMTEESYAKTLEEKKLVFYSRSRKRLWLKGESSGNYLHVKEILIDCDNDCLLIKVKPAGPVCHTGADTCFNEKNRTGNFINHLEEIIGQRKDNPLSGSYTSSLFQKGMNRISQKLGEEAIELIIESKDNDIDRFKGEAADLLFHFLVLLKAKNLVLNDIIDVLKKRHQPDL